MVSALYFCCIYSSALQIRFFHEANNMNPDQTAPMGSSLIWVILFAIKATYEHKQMTSPDGQAKG